MAIISLEGMRFYAYHGFYPEEQLIGNNYVLDVFVDANTMQASLSDDLFSTVNYETVFIICQLEMKKESKLLETVAQRILSRIQGQFNNVNGIKVKLHKLNPPLGGRVGSAAVEVSTGTLSGGSKGGGGGGFSFKF